MMSKWKTWVCGGALAGAAVVSMAAWSMGPPHTMSGDPTRIITHLGDHLDLSKEQKTEVESLVAAARQSGDADRARMQELRKQMMAMKGDFDPGKAQAIADEIGQLTGRMVYRASETFAQVYQVLNAEQRTELDNMMTRRGEHRGKWGRGEERTE